MNHTRLATKTLTKEPKQGAKGGNSAERIFKSALHPKAGPFPAQLWTGRKGPEGQVF